MDLLAFFLKMCLLSEFLMANVMNLSQVQVQVALLPDSQMVGHCDFFFRSESLSPYTTWLSTISDTDALLAEWGKGGVVTVDMGGRIRLWETGLEHLQRSLTEWRNMVGQEHRHMQVPLELTLPLKGAHSCINFILNVTVMKTCRPTPKYSCLRG